MNSSRLYDSMEERENKSFLKQRLQYKPVWLTVILSFVTLGIYLPFWLLTRRNEINKLAGKNIIGKQLPMFILLGYSLSALVFTIGPFFINEVALMLYEYVDIFITYIGVISILFYSFRIRAVLLKEDEGEKINKLLTFLLTIWYIQYQINKRY